jgi:Icc-related predicted phosphoesterase
MKLVHFSDWHLREIPTWRRLPPADLYVVTGDMLPDYPVFVPDQGWRLDPNSGALQSEWIRQSGGLRQCLGSPDAPVIVCRGNHDWTDLAPLFGGEVYEIGEDASIVFEVAGLRVGGCRGVRSINGLWADELDDPTFDERVQALPTDLDLIVTHSPPWGHLDEYPVGRSLGSKALTRHLMKLSFTGKPPKAWCFGHIHESKGHKEVGETWLSNAATTFKPVYVTLD